MMFIVERIQISRQKNQQKEESNEKSTQKKNGIVSSSNMDSEYVPPQNTPKRAASNRPAPPSPKKPKSQTFEWEKEDAEVIEAAIVRYGLNYKAIWEQNFRDGKRTTTQYQMKKFINSEPMAEIKQKACEGTIHCDVCFH